MPSERIAAGSASGASMWSQARRLEFIRVHMHIRCTHKVYIIDYLAQSEVSTYKRASWITMRYGRMAHPQPRKAKYMGLHMHAWPCVHLLFVASAKRHKGLLKPSPLNLLHVSCAIECAQRYACGEINEPCRSMLG